jgi:hypothetical protein
MKLTSHDGEQTLTLEWGGAGLAIVLTIEEADAMPGSTRMFETNYTLQDEEAIALAAVLEDMVEERRRPPK